MRSTFFPLELRFHIFQFLLISTKCHNPLEKHGRNEHHIFFIFAFPNLFFGMAMEHVVFTLCFTVFYVFLWNGLINRSSIFIAEELDVCPCWNRKILHLPWMTKDVWNMLTIWSAVSFILVILFRSRTSSNQATSSRIQHHPTHFTWRYYTLPHPPHPPFFKQQRNFQRSNIFQPGNLFQDSTSSNALHMTLLHPPHPPPHPPSVNNNETFNVATSSNQATPSRIQHHPTHFTWRYYTPPPPPPPPFFKQQRNFQRSNIFQPGNPFQDSTSSNHFTWRYYTPPHPPHPPSVNNNETFNVATSSNQATSSRIQHHPTHFTLTWRYYPPTPPICIQERPFWYSIKTEGSSKLRGTLSLEPIYIYIHIYIYEFYMALHILTLGNLGGVGALQRNVQRLHDQHLVRVASYTKAIIKVVPGATKDVVDVTWSFKYCWMVLHSLALLMWRAL